MKCGTTSLATCALICSIPRLRESRRAHNRVLNPPHPPHSPLPISGSPLHSLPMFVFSPPDRTKAIAIYNESGRFQQAGKMLQEVGEIYEAEREYDDAVQALQQAAEYLAVRWNRTVGVPWLPLAPAAVIAAAAAAIIVNVNS